MAGFVFMCVLCVGAVEGSALSVAVHVTGCVSVLCVYACVCICLRYVFSCLNVQMGKQQLHGSSWAETLGPWAPGWSPAAKAVGTLALLEEVVMLLTSLNKLSPLTVHGKACREETCSDSHFIHWV